MQSSPSLPSFPPHQASAPPPPPAQAQAPAPPSTISVPLALFLSALAATFSAGGSYFVTAGNAAQTKADVVQLRTDLTEIVKLEMKFQTDTLLALAGHERRLADAERGAGESTRIHEDLRVMSSKIDALCRANRAANCGP